MGRWFGCASPFTDRATALTGRAVTAAVTWRHKTSAGPKQSGAPRTRRKAHERPYTAHTPRPHARLRSGPASPLTGGRPLPARSPPRAGAALLSGTRSPEAGGRAGGRRRGGGVVRINRCGHWGGAPVPSQEQLMHRRLAEGQPTGKRPFHPAAADWAARGGRGRDRQWRDRSDGGTLLGCECAPRSGRWQSEPTPLRPAQRCRCRRD